ncbi:DUF4184 family protein [Actinoplanes sp. NBRC 101535]|uniref:DUF4184 family protein n=1 Tax=Actinoplanes sp. NBRC 101535 TaxID=3032196 RepID=UPI0025546B92|nr:DUF4184 family protein [Actinoplanes sp. NBRC 101535]
MPFTVSHAAAGLLFGPTPLVVSAVVAGTVAPDLPYLLPQATSAEWGPYSDFNLTYTHQVGTGLVAGTVVALLLLALFHHLLVRPLRALLPQGVVARLPDGAGRFRWLPGARLGWIVVSALVGVGTHLVWDGLVHDSGSGEWSPLPDTPAVTEALWWASTLGGMLAIAVWLGVRVRRTPRHTVAPNTVLGTAGRLVTVALLLVAGVAGALLKVGTEVTSSLSLAALRQVVTGGMSGFAVGVLLYAVWWTARSARTAEPDPFRSGTGR